MEKNFKTTFRFFILLIIGTIIMGCLQDKNMHLEKQLLKYVDEQCAKKTGECEIDLNNFLAQPWEFFYIFQGGAYSKDIQDIIGIPYTLYRDIGTKLIAINNNQITQYGEIFPPESYSTNKKNVHISFEYSNVSPEKHFRYYRLTPGNAKLKIIIRDNTIDNINYFRIYDFYPYDQNQAMN